MPFIKNPLLSLRRSSRKNDTPTSVKELTNGGDKAALSSDSDDLAKVPSQRGGRPQVEYHNERLSDRKKYQSVAQEYVRQRNERAAQDEPKAIKDRYGDLPLINTERKHGERSSIASISSTKAGEEITFRARIHVVRKMSANMTFLVFRQQMESVQGVLVKKDGEISTHMVWFAEHIPPGAVVLVKGRIQAPEAGKVTGCSIHDAEVAIQELKVITRRSEVVPFTVYEDEISRHLEERDEDGHGKITDRARLNNRILDLRTATSQAIFRIQSGVGNLFRSYLDNQGFTEIHTPKLQGGATESGSSVFKVDYFGRTAFLAQSPQLAKQMSIAADFERVYEIGPVFRAENSNTHRHLTEYVGLDLEMALEEHYHEMLEMIDKTLKHIFQGIYDKYAKELKAVKESFPHEDLVWLPETLILRFSEGIRMLVDSGYKEEDDSVPSEYEDLHTRAEIRLGELVKEKYKTDYYMLDKFPKSARPFYAMPDPEDSQVTNSFDIFLRGQEILSGGQRVHDPNMLTAQMESQGVDPTSIDDYMEGFRLGCPPHAGAGIGLERLVMLFLKLGNIRLASMYHRDPKSLPAKPITEASKLRHPRDSTLHPPWDKSTKENEKQLQPLENLIANYGDSTNTSWTEEGYHVWRHPDTGSAISYVPSDGYAIILGNPLCDKTQYGNIVKSFLKWLKKETHLKPIWILCGYDVEEFLGDTLGWRTLTCVAEERVDASDNRAESDHDVGRKIRHAEREGVKIVDVPDSDDMPEDIQDRCNVRIQDWLANRKGRQVKLASIKPWTDMQHRRYFYAVDKEGTICALVVLAQLSLEHGYQVKYSLDFPNAPSGTIEKIITHAMHAAAQDGTKNLTFGGSATSQLTPVRHMHGVRVKMLSHSYKAIVGQLKLTQKGEFRQKLGAKEDPLYICYPPHGFGAMGARAIIDFFESDHKGTDHKAQNSASGNGFRVVQSQKQEGVLSIEERALNDFATVH